MAFYDLIKRIWNNTQNWVRWVSASECLVCFLIDVRSGVKMRVLHIEPAIALGSIQFNCLWLHSSDDIIYIFCVSFHFCLVCLFTSCCRCSCYCCCCCWQKEASRSDVTCTATRAPLSASGIGSDSGRTITSDNVTSTRRGQHDELTSTSVAAPSPTLTAIATATATSSPISTWTVATHVACLTGPDTWPGCSWGSQRTLLPRVAKRDSAASEAHFCHANVHVACCRPDQTRAAPGRWLSTNWPSCGAQIQQQTGAIHFESFYCVPTATERSQGSSRSTKPTKSLNRLKARWQRLYVCGDTIALQALEILKHSKKRY